MKFTIIFSDETRGKYALKFLTLQVCSKTNMREQVALLALACGQKSIMHATLSEQVVCAEFA
jgi:D-serine deaminase-like pyridoxal phosphate-dependent protein